MNTDGLSNVVNSLTGLGVQGFDSIENTQIQYMGYQNRNFLDNAFESMWQCRKVCSYLPSMMRMAWGTVTLGSGDHRVIEKTNNHLARLRSHYQNGQILANLYGGATIIRLINDGADPGEPINRDSIEYVRYSRIFDRWEVQPDPIEIQSNPYDPEYYVFYSNYGMGNQLFSQRIHKSRVLRFRGAFLSPWRQRNNQGWEASQLMSFLTPLLRYLNAMGYVGEAMRDFEFLVFCISGLFNKIQTDEGEAEVLKRLRLNDSMRSVMRSQAIDKSTEDIKMMSRQFSGVDDILEKLKDEMIGASGLTKPQFYQEHPSGLAATGESERLAEANSIKALCEEKWDDLIKQDAELFLLSKEGLGKLPSDWGFSWNSLYAQTPLEESDIRYKTAQTDVLNIQMGIYSSQEARASHHGGSKFDTNISLESLKAEVAKTYNLESDRLDSLTLSELMELKNG